MLWKMKDKETTESTATNGRAAAGPPMPREVLEWQVALRRHTMEEAGGMPHAGVAPLLTVRRPEGILGGGSRGSLGVTTHSIICGILPAPDRLERKTAEFRAIYEEGNPEGAKSVYDRGIDYLKAYYRDASHFDPGSFTTLLSEENAIVPALRAEPRCALVFYVFDLREKSDIGRFRCLQLDCEAEVLTSGPVYENVWWHNTLFHGKAESHVVIRFQHLRTLDTGFGRLEVLG